MRYFSVAGIVLLGLTASVFGRTNIDLGGKEPQGPKALALEYCVAAHRIGKIVLAVSNNGAFGTGQVLGGGTDCFTGQALLSCEYPKNSRTTYLFGGAFWIGAVVGRDTLVSGGADGWSRAGKELLPYEEGLAVIEKRSIIDPTDPAYEGAISEEDFIFEYADTSSTTGSVDYFGRPHQPLFISVREASYAWSYAYAEDFVLFDYQVQNIGQRTLE
ncbi:MAG: hypothetical protein AB1744_08965, partial [Candidatus Zixiibacteriota bacterium]